jgi:hypothetical protein
VTISASYTTPWDGIKTFPHEWALTQSNLAASLYSIGRLKGDCISIEDAVTASDLALEIWTPAAAPYFWAATQSNIGSAYASIGEISSDLLAIDGAVQHFELALGGLLGYRSVERMGSNSRRPR